MGIATYSYNRSTSGGEIIRELVNASDGQGLHFDGAGSIDIATPPDLGTKFSFEFIIQADSWPASGSNIYIVDFGNGGRFVLGNPTTGNFSVRSVTGDWLSFGSALLDDLKVHHVVVTVDGTSAIAYDNGNQIGTATITSPNIDSCADARIGSDYVGTASFFTGTIYRARFWNKTLSQAEVTASYENATVPFADQYGVQGILTATDFTSASGWAFETNVAFDAGNNQVDFSSAGNGYGFHKTKTATKVGQIYRTTMVISNHSGGSVAVRVGGMFGTNRSGNGTFTEDITITAAGTLFGAQAKAAGTTLSVDSITTDLIGCVSDYDLAFANPTQSTMVQDRAGAADGTASSGVTQVTPIEQLNSKALSVGTSAATPADGELLVSENVGVGIGAPASAYDHTVHIHNAAGSGASVHITDTNSGSGVGDGLELINYGTTAYVYNRTAGNLHLGTDNTARLSIDSAGAVTATGNVGVGGSPTSPSSLARYLYVGDTASAGIVLDDTNSTPWEIYNIQGSLYFAPNGGTAEVTFASSGLCSFSNGIAFSGQTDATGTGITSGATTLDHYEEGTWTPGFDTTAGDLANFTDYTAVGYYTRIGRLVVCLCSIGTTGAGSISGTGTVQIKGLPFPAVGNRSAIALTGGRWTTQPAYGYVGASTSTAIDLRQDFDTVTAVADFSASASANQNVIEFMCSYTV